MSRNDARASDNAQTGEITDADLPVEGRDFERGTWHGMDRFQCSHCPWDTTYAERIIAHFISRHKPKPLPVDRPIEATLFDASGNQIERVPLPGETR
jgi:hypothetical protein